MFNAEESAPAVDDDLVRTLQRDAETKAPFLLATDRPSGSPYALPVGTLSNDGVAVVGHDGWMYIAGGYNHWSDQFIGARNLTAEQIGQWRDLIGGRQRFFASRDIRYLHLTIPEKHCVHPERFPSPLRAGLRPILQIGSMPNLLYPLDVLRAYAERLPVWLRGNSHWNVYGCYLVARELLSSVGFPAPAWEDIRIDATAGVHDLIFKFAPDWREPMRAVRTPGRELFNNRLWETEKKHVGNHYILYNANATHRDTLCIFGDSYSWDAGFSHLLSHVFEQVHFIWTGNVSAEYCNVARASVVISETTERNMIVVPGNAS